jgi:lysophospholipase L1-like esterase
MNVPHAISGVVAAILLVTACDGAPVRGALEEWGLLAPWYERGLYAERVNEHALENARVEAPCVLLLGDSLTAALPMRQLGVGFVNRGISGDRASIIARRLPATVLSTPCATVVVMVGVNDLVRDRATPDQIVADLRSTLGALRVEARAVVLLSLLPVAGAYAGFGGEIRAVNAGLRTLAGEGEGIRFLDLTSDYADGNGNLRADLTEDGLHLHPKAYGPWLHKLEKLEG